jgi:hypothetical protein
LYALEYVIQPLGLHERIVCVYKLHQVEIFIPSLFFLANNNRKINPRSKVVHMDKQQEIWPSLTVAQGDMRETRASPYF